MSDELIVRDARADERDAVRDLTMHAYGEYAAVMAPAMWRSLEGAVRAALASDAPAHRIVATRNDVIVGSVMLYPPDTDAYGDLAAAGRWPELRLLAVASDARGLGVGETLVRECIRRARAEGAPAIGLHTSASMRGAMRLYHRLGFVRAPETDFQPEGAELVQGYRLPL